MKASGKLARKDAQRVHRRHHDVAAEHGEAHLRQVDELHHPHGHREADGDDEQQHAIGEAVEQNGEQRAHGHAGLGAAGARRRPTWPDTSLIVAISTFCRTPSRLSTADVDVLRDVAVALVDRDRPARAFDRAALDEGHELVGVERGGALRSDAVVDQAQRIPDRNIRRRQAWRLAELTRVVRHELLVRRRIVRRGIHAGGDHAEPGVAGSVDDAVVGQITRPEQLDGRALQSRIGIGLQELRYQLADRKEDEDGVGLRILDALHVAGELRAAHRDPPRPRQRSTAFGEGLGEARLGVVARPEIGNQHVGLLDAVFQRPVGHGTNDLRNGKEGSHVVRRLLADDSVGRRTGEERRHLGLSHHRRHRQHVGSEVRSDEDLDLFAHDQLLRQPFRDFGIGTRGVALDELDLLAADGGAVLLLEQLDRVVAELSAHSGGAGIGEEQADPDRLLSHCGSHESEGRRNAREDREGTEVAVMHECLHGRALFGAGLNGVKRLKIQGQRVAGAARDADHDSIGRIGVLAQQYRVAVIGNALEDARLTGSADAVATRVLDRDACVDQDIEDRLLGGTAKVTPLCASFSSNEPLAAATSVAAEAGAA